MFELDDIVLEGILFAMEDQSHSSRIDAGSGKVLRLETGDVPGTALMPPSWSSEDGFRLMEDFRLSLRNPAARSRLTSVLARGRGVFRAFKEALAEYPGLEESFREFKMRTMRRRVLVWYEDLREAAHLERLGPEPEDGEELLRVEMPFTIAPLDEVLEQILDLGMEMTKDLHIQDEDTEPSGDGSSALSFPGSLAVQSWKRFFDVVESHKEALCVFCEDEAGGLAACSAGYVMRFAGRRYAYIGFVAVRREFQRMGLGSAAIRELVAAYRARGLSDIVVDIPSLPAEFALAMETRGYRSFGMRALAPAD